MDYKGKCSSCTTEFIVSDIVSVPLFNSVRKYDWNVFTCTTCGTKNRFARFTKNSNLLVVVS